MTASRDDDRSADAERPKKRAAEKQQTAETRGDREARETYDAPGVIERVRECFGIAATCVELFSVTTDGEERIVDRDAEPDQRADVDRVRGHVDEMRKPHHHGDAADDRKRADTNWQRRGDDGAKREQENEQRERKRHDLRTHEIVIEHAIEVIHERHFARARDDEVGRAQMRAHVRIVRKRRLEVAFEAHHRDRALRFAVHHRRREHGRRVFRRHDRRGRRGLLRSARARFASQPGNTSLRGSSESLWKTATNVVVEKSDREPAR